MKATGFKTQNVNNNMESTLVQWSNWVTQNFCIEHGSNWATQSFCIEHWSNWAIQSFCIEHWSKSIKCVGGWNHTESVKYESLKTVNSSLYGVKMKL